MQSRLERSLQQDIDLIQGKVIEMGGLVESTLRVCVQAIDENNRQLAYAVILKDRFIDALENELDALCQKFLLVHQPVAGHLRFIYAVIKINNELERVGDYAKSIARQFLAISFIEPQPDHTQIVEIANQAIPLLRNALRAFAERDADKAQTIRAKEKDKTIDNLRYSIHHNLIHLHSMGQLPSGALPPLMTIANRFERVGDQAGNVCEEVIYMCTGEEVKHREEEKLRILFVDEHDACRGQIAEGIGNALNLKDFVFSSAGIAPEDVDPKTIQLMADRGIDISQQQSQYLHDIVELKNYQVIIGIGVDVESQLPTGLNTVNIAWETDDPSRMQGTEAEIEAAYEKAYQYLNEHIRDLIQAVISDNLNGRREDETS